MTSLVHFSLRSIFEQNTTVCVKMLKKQHMYCKSASMRSHNNYESSLQTVKKDVHVLNSLRVRGEMRRGMDDYGKEVRSGTERYYPHPTRHKA